MTIQWVVANKKFAKDQKLLCWDIRLENFYAIDLMKSREEKITSNVIDWEETLTVCWTKHVYNLPNSVIASCSETENTRNKISLTLSSVKEDISYFYHKIDQCFKNWSYEGETGQGLIGLTNGTAKKYLTCNQSKQKGSCVIYKS